MNRLEDEIQLLQVLISHEKDDIIKEKMQQVLTQRLKEVKGDGYAV